MNLINGFYYDFFFLILNIIKIWLLKYLLFIVKRVRRDGSIEGGDLLEVEEGSRGEKEISVS